MSGRTVARSWRLAPHRRLALLSVGIGSVLAGFAPAGLAQAQTLASTRSAPAAQSDAADSDKAAAANSNATDASHGESDAAPSHSARYWLDLARQTESDRATERTTAFRTLRQHGPEAIPALEQIVREGSRDSATQAWTILRDAAINPLPRLHDPARAALTRLAQTAPAGLGRDIQALVARKFTPQPEEDLTQLNMLGGGRLMINNRPPIQAVMPGGFIQPPGWKPQIEVLADQTDPGKATIRRRGGEVIVEAIRNDRHVRVKKTLDGRFEVETRPRSKSVSDASGERPDAAQPTPSAEGEGQDQDADAIERYRVHSLKGLMARDASLAKWLHPFVEGQPESTVRLSTARPDLPAALPLDQMPAVIAKKSALKTIEAQLTALKRMAEQRPSDGLARRIADLETARRDAIEQLRSFGVPMP